jgi:hypothetical protein
VHPADVEAEEVEALVDVDHAGFVPCEVQIVGRPGRTGGVVQRRATSWRCQRRIVDGVASIPWRLRTGSGRARAVITPRSVQLIRRCGVRRCSTASWWRRTRISISLLVSDRVRSTMQPRSLENAR